MKTLLKPWAIFNSSHRWSFFPPTCSTKPCRATEPNIFYKPNWDKLTYGGRGSVHNTHRGTAQSNEVPATLEECLKNPILMDQHLTTLTTLSLQTAYNSIPLKKYSPYKKKNRVGMKISTRHSDLPNKLIEYGRLPANPGTQTILCAIVTNRSLRENSTLS